MGGDWGFQSWEGVKEALGGWVAKLNPVDSGRVPKAGEAPSAGEAPKVGEDFFAALQDWTRQRLGQWSGVELRVAAGGRRRVLGSRSGLESKDPESKDEDSGAEGEGDADLGAASLACSALGAEISAIESETDPSQELEALPDSADDSLCDSAESSLSDSADDSLCDSAEDSGDSPEDAQKSPQPHLPTICYRDAVGFLADWQRSLCRGRLFINTAAQLPIGQKVQVQVELPTRRFAVLAEARVRWRREAGNRENLPPGVCVALNMQDEGSRALENLAKAISSEGIRPMHAPSCWNPEGLERRI